MAKGAGWRGTERRVAKAIGGRRNGNTGTATADCENDWLCCEVKHWAALPAKVTQALEQAERAAKPDQLPIAVIHKTGQRSGRDLVILRWGDFLDHFGGPESREEEPNGRA